MATTNTSTSVKSAGLSAIVTQIGTSGYLVLSSNAVPATPDTAMTGILVTLTLSSVAGTVSGTPASLTLGAIASGTVTVAGTALSGRLMSTASAGSYDFDVSTSGATMNLSSASLTSGETVSVSSFVIAG